MPLLRDQTGRSLDAIREDAERAVLRCFSAVKETH